MMSQPAMPTPYPASADGGGVMEDPRLFRYIRADHLRCDQRIQRETSPERVARIVNEFDWSQFECLTVVDANDTTYVVVEGQHRTLAVQEMNPAMLVPALIITSHTSIRQQAQIQLNIVKGRSHHSAYEQWRERFNAGHPHEIYATMVMDRHKVRVGQGPSAMTIGAVATIRRIVHGGNFTPEQGGELLDKVLNVVLAAFPTYDRESNVNRWNAAILLAVGGTLAKAPDADQARLAKVLRIRPATQWVNIGKGVAGTPPHVAIQEAMINEYNRNRRSRRIEL